MGSSDGHVAERRCCPLRASDLARASDPGLVLRRRRADEDRERFVYDAPGPPPT